jgi:hypothetical protein
VTAPLNNLPPFPLTRASLCLLAVAAGGAVGAAALTSAGGRWDQLAIALGTVGVCLVAAVAALLPIRAASRVNLQRVVLVMLLTFPLRLVLVTVGVIAVGVALRWPVLSAALWTLLWYLVFLCVEIGLVVRYLQSSDEASGRPAMHSASPAPANPATGLGG